MNAKMKIASLVAALCALASPALAATGIREDHSGIVVWAFLGFCALIVVAQLVPAALMLFGMVKGIAQKGETPASVEAK